MYSTTKALLLILFISLTTLVNAQSNSGTHISIEKIHLDNGEIIPSGEYVEFLGVIEVPTDISPSGSLATFSYQDKILNADAAYFYRPETDASMYLLPARAVDKGDKTSLCTNLVDPKFDDPFEINIAELKNYIRISSNDKKITNFAIKGPIDTLSSYRRKSDFCVEGLEHSTEYELTVMSGLQGVIYNGIEKIDLNKDVKIFASTPDKSPRIELDSFKNILPIRSNSVIPITTTNINRIDVTLYHVDLNSIASYSDVFRTLKNRDVEELESFWGTKIGQRSIYPNTELNKKTKVNVGFDRWIDDNQSGIFVATFTSDELDTDYWDPIPTQWFMVSNIGSQIYKGLDFTDILLTNFETLEPIQNGAVRIIAANNKTLFSESTDANGRLRISNKFMSGSDGFAPKYIILSSSTDGTSILDASRISQKPRTLFGGKEKKHQTDVFITSDRNIYRIGDTINIFGVARNLSLDPISNADLSITLNNQSNGKLSKVDVTTDEFGAFSSSIKINASFRLGRYSLRVETPDTTILSTHDISIQDFAPLTIDPNLSTKNKFWNLNQTEQITLKSEYLSGGPTSGLDAEISFQLRNTRSHPSESLTDYLFGSNQLLKTFETERFYNTLGEDGVWTTTLETDFSIQNDTMYQVVLEGSVQDVGGRSNKSVINIPLDTTENYLGLRNDFENSFEEGATPVFNVVNVDISGNEKSLDGSKYSVKRLFYEYNWYYDDGWRWRRVKVSDEVVENGEINQKQFSLTTPLEWGQYELQVSNSEQFTTEVEFHVGWGANANPSTEPEELSIVYTGENILRFESPFAGLLNIIIASENIDSEKTLRVEKGKVSVPFDIRSMKEPGVHILASLTRAVSEGSEHLPQIAIGKTWVPHLNQSREISLDLKSSKSFESSNEVEVVFQSSQTDGSALLFMVDEGIHLVTGYKNQNLRNHYLSERELTLGFLTNFGSIIQQDKSLKTFLMGGGDEISDPGSNVDKSKFFKTIARSSGIIPIEDGTIRYTFPEPGMEGKFRVVAFAVSSDGFGMTTEHLQVQDPVSLDISLPRFLAPDDTVLGKLQVRSNDFSGEVKINVSVDDTSITKKIELQDGETLVDEIKMQVSRIGTIPVTVEMEFGNKKVRRSYEIVSRSGMMPSTELLSFYTSKTNWLGRSTTNVPGIISDSIDLSSNSTSVQVSISPNLGINLQQAVQALNRYPYGCIEQTSSGVRGNLAYVKINGISQDLREKINSGIDKIINKQKSNGSFGYWDRFSSVYEEYQPYALETLQLALPYAQDPEKVSKSIEQGLNYLFHHSFDDPETRLYSYGILAKSGYEVTSRARYHLDQIIKTQDSIKKVDFTNKNSGDNLDRLALSYWVASLLNDDLRMQSIDTLLSKFSERPTTMRISHQASEVWGNLENSTQLVYRNWTTVAPSFGRLLAQINEQHLTEEIKNIVNDTQSYLSTKRYRSTLDNSSLVDLHQTLADQLQNIEIQIDGETAKLSKDGTVSLSSNQILKGFELHHRSKTPLILNAEVYGKRTGLGSINRGFEVKKYWHDKDGNEVDLSNGVLESQQGDLFTVVLEIERTSDKKLGDILITDLLPAGFEIEDTQIANPMVDGLEVNFGLGEKPDYTALMDDRFIAHFEDRWFRGYALLKYVVRAAYVAESQISDAQIEHMYSPDIYGRSPIAKAIVKEK